MALTDRPMDVLTEAERLGFRLYEALRDDTRCWVWSRGADHRWPSFPTKGSALEWMEDSIRHGTLFDR